LERRPAAARLVHRGQVAGKIGYAAIPEHGFPLSGFKAMPARGKAEIKNAADSFENCLPRSVPGIFHVQMNCKGYNGYKVNRDF
jgi:hypothetical protein